ncbi:MAG: radical SAM protein [Deltaproteobacteria bacterium]|jgi:nitrogen fixation protein NifB|nr:radical SAM protein [Deltaproteobacteria bacterium]
MDARHPCFNASAGDQWGRIHLPVAPDCNISCAYCNRKTDCLNESRPGVCSRTLTPEEAAYLVDKAVRQMPSLAVAGIAGPGDPLANPESTLRTFELVRRRHPGLLLCLSTNGLMLADYMADLQALGVGHITVTINAVIPAVARHIYSNVRANGRSHHGLKAAEIILNKQEKALAAAERHGVTLKVNTVVIPGVNDEHVEDIAHFAARFRVGLMNCIGLIPVRGTPMSSFTAPTAKRMDELRKRAGKHVPQMRHCMRCRADAFGPLSRDSRIENMLNARQYALSSLCASSQDNKCEFRETLIYSLEGALSPQTPPAGA